MDQAELRAAAEALHLINEAGELQELRADIFAECHRHNCIGSLDEQLKRSTINQQFGVCNLADTLVQLLGAPRRDCMEAAASVFLTTRRQIAVDCVARRAKDIAEGREAWQ